MDEARRFDVVRTELKHVPRRRRRELVAHLLERVVAPEGRLVIGKRGGRRTSSRGGGERLGLSHRRAGGAAHHLDPRFVYRVFWIERD